MIRTLQKKFVVTAMAAVTVLLVVLLGAINVFNAWTISRQSDNLLENLVRLEPQQMHPGGFRDERRTLFGPNPTEDDRMAAVFFSVRTNGAGEIVGVDTGRIASVSDEEAVRIAESEIRSGKLSGTVGYYKYQAFDSPGAPGRTYVFLDVSANSIGIARVAALCILAGIVCWGLMLLLVIALSRKAIRPIAENIQRQKQFVTDAGHEIKTPLAIILANTEAMELYQGESKWSRNIREQTRRLNGLMQNLLILARSDESSTPMDWEQVDLSRITADTMQMFAEPMGLKNLMVAQQIEAGLLVGGNKQQLERLVSILADNAAKYAAPDSTVEISLQKQGKSAVLQMKNVCQTLPDCDPDKLFDRFYRADAARTQKNGGYGIGLSAAKAIAEQHGGRIRAAYEDGNRIVFTVSLS